MTSLNICRLPQRETVPKEKPDPGDRSCLAYRVRKNFTYTRDMAGIKNTVPTHTSQDESIGEGYL